MTQSELETYLWDAAVLLRGFIDAGDYKQFIFPLLFFKRLCDVYDEETARAERERGEVFREDHRLELIIPKGAHWNDVRQQATNVGTAIQNAMRTIGANNPQLYGIFGDAPWTNKQRLSDSTLRDLIEHFSSQTLSLERVSDDLLGQGYEYLIKKFADDSGHTAAEFYTNRTVVELMTQLLDPQPGESVYDPTCGSGGMLLAAAMELRRQGREYRNLRLYGQEINLMTSAMARMNLYMHGFEDFEVIRGDTLSTPAFIRDDELRQFDIILANPPYSIKQWDREAWTTDPFDRNFLGVPPQGRADYAFLQHILKSLKPASGRCAVLFPHGVLFRDEERAMRKRLLEEYDLVECVIGLGPNLFYNSPMEACILICRRNKDSKRQNHVLFINAISKVTRRQAQSFLEDEHIAEIVQAYRNFADVEGFAKVVSVEELLANNASLSIPLYVRTPNGKNGKEKTLGEVITDWQASSRSLRDSMQLLFTQLQPDPIPTEHEPLPVNFTIESMRVLGDRINEIAQLYKPPQQQLQDAIQNMMRSLRDIAPMINPYQGVVDRIALTLPKIEPIMFAQFAPITFPNYSAMLDAFAPKIDWKSIIDATTLVSGSYRFEGLNHLDEVVKATQQALAINVPSYSIASTLLAGLTANNAASLRGFFDNLDDGDFDEAVDYLTGTVPFEELPETLQLEVNEFKAYVYNHSIAVLTLVLFTLSLLDLIQTKALPTANDLLRDLILVLLFLKDTSKEDSQ
jgi:type I restriction enzyme M protein